MSSMHEEIRAARELIASLHGVEDAEIVCEDNRVTQVRVLKSPGAGPAQAARIVDNVSAILSARMERTLDPGGILVLRAPSREHPAVDGWDAARLRIEKAEEVLRDLTIEVSVALSLREEVRETRLQGPRHGRIPLMVRAGLLCASRFINGASLELDHIRHTSIGERNAILVSSTLCAARRDEVLLGAAFIEDSPAEAALRAALDGVNRRLGPLLANALGCARDAQNVMRPGTS